MAQEPSAPQSPDGVENTPSAAPATVESALVQLREALGSHRVTPGDASFNALRGAVRRLATLVEGMPRQAREGGTVMSVLESARALWSCGYLSRRPPDEDIERATGGLKHGWPGIVSGMLLAPCWAWNGAPTLAQVPDWLWGDFMNWVLTPPLGAAPRVADKHVARITDYIWELAGWMERNRGSEAVRAAGEAFLDHASSPLPLHATCDLKPYATARGRLVGAIARTRTGDSKIEAAPRDGRPLRIGILSRDFADSADNRALLPVVSNLDPERVELVLFAEKFGASPIELAFRKAAAVFNHLPAQRIARLELCAQAGCDVIVFSGDIARATDDFAGLALQRLAPLQAVLPTNPFTTGLPAIDLRVLGEATAEPSTEQLALLPGSGLAFSDPAVAGNDAAVPLPATRSEFGLPAQGPLFISAAHPDLFASEILGAWSRLLRAVPESTLLLILPESADPFLAEELPVRIAGFGGTGASRAVVVFDDARRALSLDGIYLDTFPTSDPEALAAALRSSLPAVAWSGGTHRSRTGAALLRELGGGALVADDESGYISRASELAVDEEHRAETGARLAASSHGSDTLAMADALTGLFERAFGVVLANSCRPKSRDPIRLGFTPEEIESIREQTFKALAMGCPGKAVAATRLWLQGEPGSADARLLHARALRLTGRNTRALTYALAALTGNEDEPEAWLEAAAALRANNQADEAISAYEAALKLDGSCVEAWIALAELANEAGHHDFASEAARAARELSPSDPRVAALAMTA